MPGKRNVRRIGGWGGVLSAAALGATGCFGASSTTTADTGDAAVIDAGDAAAPDGASSEDSGPSADGGPLADSAVGPVEAGSDASGPDAADGGPCAGGGGPATFTCTGSLSVPREAPGGAVLASGKVLVAGGWNATSGTLSTAELYDPATAAFTPTGPMSAAHLWAGWTSPWPVLASGKVLAAGGLDAAGNLLTGAELYDPVAATFSATGPLSTGVIAFGATSLSDGTALFIGGYSAVTGAPPTPGWMYTSGTAQVQQYSPSTGMFGAAGNLAEARLFGCNVRLPSGDVLAIGGWIGAPATFESNIERYDAVMGQWSTVGALGAGVMCGASAFVLPGGQVLLDGSALLDPTSYQTTPTGNVLALSSPTLVQLANGDVLAAGGTVNNQPTAQAQVYSVSSGTWTSVGSMHFARSGGHRLLLLGSGDVLVVGGADSAAMATAEIYHP